MKSLLAVPLYHDDRLEAVLALTSDEKYGFGKIDSFTLEFLSEVITGLLVEERYRGKVRSKEQRHARLNSFLLDASRIDDMQVLFERAATIIADHLQTTMVRISNYESTGYFLDSKAMVLQKPLDSVVPSNGHLVLDLMPYHQLVRNTGRAMMVNQENTDKKISEAECSQAFFPGLKSALLVPIKVDEKVLGVISLAEERSWESFQFQQTDILYVTSIASVLALTFLKGGVVTGQDKISDDAIPRKLFRENDKQESYPFRQDQLNTSMSGISNSVETMHSRLGLPETTNGGCLTDIDHSADDIRRCTEDNFPI